MAPIVTRLDRLLRTLYVQGYWIDAWYPLSSRDEFECRIASGEYRAWATSADALEALAIAMRNARLPTEDWDEDTEADNLDDLAAAADFYDQIGGGHD